MPSIAQHQSLEYVKALVLGVPGSGKTGGLVSLVKAGYRLVIYDFDNLLASLIGFINAECPERAGQVFFQTFTDDMKGVKVPMSMVGNSMKITPFLKGQPKAFINALMQLNHWQTEDEDLGDPSTFGTDTVVVIDSLTTASMAAMRYVQGMNPNAREQQSYYHAAQQLIINLINLLCASQFQTHVLILAHITYDKDEKGNLLKGWPRSMGSALNDQLGGYFNSVLQFDRVGTKRELVTEASGLVDLKNPVSFSVPKRLPIETGLAEFFRIATNRQPTGVTNA